VRSQLLLAGRLELLQRDLSDASLQQV